MAIEPLTMREINILLVEDNKDDIEFFLDALSQSTSFHKISVVQDGEDALKYLFKKEEFHNANTPDLIILDLSLPKVTGFDVLQTLKEHDTLSHIPTIVFTSSYTTKNINIAYRLGANCCIIKPTTSTKYSDVIQKIESFWLSVACLPITEEEKISFSDAI